MYANNKKASISAKRHLSGLIARWRAERLILIITQWVSWVPAKTTALKLSSGLLRGGAGIAHAPALWVTDNQAGGEIGMVRRKEAGLSDRSVMGGGRTCMWTNSMGRTGGKGKRQTSRRHRTRNWRLILPWASALVVHHLSSSLQENDSSNCSLLSIVNSRQIS